MSLRIIFKQIYKGFLINWKLFIMLIFFCIATLSVIFGSLAFAIQFKNEIYSPAISKTAFSVGNLKNDFSYSDDENANFKTSKKFETYFLNKINKIGETENSIFEFTDEDLRKIYQENGYVNWVETTNEEKPFYEKLINYSADFLGNIRFKVLSQYLKEQINWTLNIWNNQSSVAKLSGTNGNIKFLTTNIKHDEKANLMIHHQMIADDPNFVSIYIGQHQLLNKMNKIGDLITIKFEDSYHSKNLQAKIVGTFVDYINFADSNLGDTCFSIDNQDYFHFVQNQNIGYDLLDYRQQSKLNLPRLALFTKQNYSSPSKYESQFSQANDLVNDLCFDHFQGLSLNDEFKIVYAGLQQKYLMVILMMLGISFLLIILFYLVLYFLITQTIKSDLKISFFLNHLGMNYREISLIQILRLTIPLCFSILLAFFCSFLVKNLFWKAFSPYYNIHLNFLYFHWENLLVLFGSLVFIFGILFLINSLINWKLAKSKNTFERVTVVDQISTQTKSLFKIKNPYLVIGFSYGAKNFFQIIFISFITLMIFLIAGFSLNFTKNIQNISQIAPDHYAPIQSISGSKGQVIVEEDKSTYTFIKNGEFEAIGADINLIDDEVEEIILKLQKLFTSENLSSFYLSHFFTKQLNQDFADNFNRLQYQNLSEEIKSQISEENFLKLQSIITNCAFLNSQLKNNFSWNEGYNVNFSQWTNTDFSSFDQTFFNLENTVHDSITNLYLSSIPQTFAVNSENSYYQTNFQHLNDDFSSVILKKTPEQIALSELDQDLDKNHDGEILLKTVVNAYFPFLYKDEKFLKLKVSFNNQIVSEVYLRNVGVNLSDNWDQIFILNKRQLFEFLDLNFKGYQKDLKINLFDHILTSRNFEQLDNGVYSTSSVPFFYQNILVRDDGKGKAMANYLSSLESLNIYGLNFNQIQKIVKQKLDQYNNLITSIQILLFILMVTISFIIIFLVVKENESYFQSFKALGYQNKEITFFLLPWYFVGSFLSALGSFLIIFFTNNLVGSMLSHSLSTYLNYQVNLVVYFALIIIPFVFILLFSITVYLFVQRVKITNVLT